MAAHGPRLFLAGVKVQNVNVSERERERARTVVSACRGATAWLSRTLAMGCRGWQLRRLAFNNASSSSVRCLPFLLSFCLSVISSACRTRAQFGASAQRCGHCWKMVTILDVSCRVFSWSPPPKNFKTRCGKFYRTIIKRIVNLLYSIGYKLAVAGDKICEHYNTGPTFHAFH